MRKILHLIHQSIDGYIAGPKGEFDWPVMGPELSAYTRELNSRADTFLYGRVVWDMMVGFWPKAEEISDDPHDVAFAPVWRATPKIVVSRTLEDADWNTAIVSDLASLADIKAEEGNDILMIGGSDLAASLTEEGLIDEYQIMVHPVVLGGGKPVFQPPRERLDFKLAETRTFDSRVAMLRYER